MTKEEAAKVVRDLWDSNGACQSCGWHAALYEYERAYGSLEDALDIDESKRRIELSCLSEDDDPSSHRGVRIYY